MKKFKKGIGIFSILLLGLLMVRTFGAYAKIDIPKKIVISTGSRTVGKAYIENFSVTAQKITSKAGVGYCLEIYKEYPSGQEFTLKGDCSKIVKNILINGYPNRTAAELGVDSDNDAYFATQIAMWSAIEGYDVDKITTDDAKVTKAIRNIYKNSQAETRTEIIYEAKEYYFNAETQHIVLLFKEEVNVEEPTPPTEEPIPPVEEPTPPTEEPIPPVEEPTPPTDVPTPPVEELPHTGGINVIVPIATGVISIFGGTYLTKKKR